MESKNDTYNAYFRNYRAENGDRLRNLDKVKYYKKKGLDEELIKTYGEWSGDIYKLSQLVKKLHKNAPNIKICEIERRRELIRKKNAPNKIDLKIGNIFRGKTI